jgi:hypothetical protein
LASPLDRSNEQSGSYHRSVTADRLGESGRSLAGFRSQRRPERGQERPGSGDRAIVRRTDAEFADTTGPIGLVGNLGHHHLRRAGACRCRSRSGTAMMHNGGDPGEERLLIDLADSEAVFPIVDPRRIRPALGEDHAPAVRADCLNGDAGRVFRGVHGHAAEANINRGIACIEEGFQLGRERARVWHDPCPGL